MTAMRERFKDDKAKQQAGADGMYKKGKINPLAGCLRSRLQIPVFFSLYKVLFVTNRNAARAVLRLDPRSVGARPRPIFSTVRPHFRSDPTVLPVVGSFLHVGAGA